MIFKTQSYLLSRLILRIVWRGKESGSNVSIFQRLQLRSDVTSVGERMWTGAQAWPGMNLHGITLLLPHHLVDHLIMDLCSEGTEAEKQRPRIYSFYHPSSYPSFFPSFHIWLCSTHSVPGPVIIPGWAMKSRWIIPREDGFTAVRMPLHGFMAFSDF